MSELDDIRESIRAVNGNIDTLTTFMAAFINKTDERFKAHDDLIQTLIDTQKHGYQKLDQDVQELKRLIGESK
jgi:hypothetical protein